MHCIYFLTVDTLKGEKKKGFSLGLKQKGLSYRKIKHILLLLPKNQTFFFSISIFFHHKGFYKNKRLKYFMCDRLLISILNSYEVT